MPTPRRRLGEILIQAGAITQGQLAEALAKQKETGGFLGQILVELGYLSQNALVSFLVKQCKIPHINLLDYQISEDILSLLPQEMCLRHGVLPIDKLGRILTVAMVDPFDIDALEELRASCPELRLKPILCEWNHFDQVVRQIFKLEKGVSEEVSAESFGLTDRRQPKPQPPPAEQPPPRDTAQAAPATEPPKAVKTEGKPAAPAAPAPKTAQTAATGVSAEDLAGTVSRTIQEAVRQSMAGVGQASAASGPSGKELMDGMREGIRDAVKEALAVVTQQSAASTATPEQLAGIMQDVLRDAIRDAVAGVAQAAQTQGASAELIASLQQSQVAQEARLDQLGEAVIQAAQAAQAAAQAAVAAQEGQTARDHEEARRAAEEAEAAAVADETRKALQGDAAAQRKKKQAAAILGKAESDALEAIEGPGLKLRLDERIVAALDSETPLNGYTFANFFVGEANEFTLRVCKAVAELPGGEYNPFFLYGDVGLGKTHLINAIGNAIIEGHSEKTVGYISSSRFASKLKDAIEQHGVEQFREYYCQWETLILDDIQFLGGRVEAQEEFFHIFNALHQEGRQIIIAADKPPDRLGQLEKRLVSRFGSGIVACVQPPDWDTRLRILRHHISESQAKVSEEVTALIATRVTTDVRKMTGSLRKVLAYAELVGREVSYDLVDEILGHLGVEKEPK